MGDNVSLMLHKGVADEYFSTDSLQWKYIREADTFIFFNSIGNLLNHSGVNELIAELQKYMSLMPDGTISNINNQDRMSPSSTAVGKNSRPGHVYLIYLSEKKLHRIGFSSDLQSRYNNHRNNHGKIEILHEIPVDNMGNAEAHIQAMYRESWTGHGDWFDLSDIDVKEIQEIAAYKDGEVITSSGAVV